MGTDAGRGDDAGTRLGVESIEGDPDAQTLRVTGELDLVTAAEFGDGLRQHLAEGPVLLDLSALTFMDSSGVSLAPHSSQRSPAESRVRSSRSMGGW